MNFKHGDKFHFSDGPSEIYYVWRTDLVPDNIKIYPTHNVSDDNLWIISGLKGQKDLFYSDCPRTTEGIIELIKSKIWIHAYDKNEFILEGAL